MFNDREKMFTVNLKKSRKQKYIKFDSNDEKFYTHTHTHTHTHTLTHTH